MAAIIPALIPTQSAEVIRDRIGLILAEELPNQKTLAAGALDAIVGTVWKERYVTFDKTACPAVNVSLSQVDFGDQTTVQQDGLFTFFIDTYGIAKTTSTVAGDTQSMLNMQRLAGLVRGILMDTRYLKLGFTTPFIGNRTVKSFAIAMPNTEDATSVTMGRITFTVRAPQTVPPKVADEIAGYQTTVKLLGNNIGYFWDSNLGTMPNIILTAADFTGGTYQNNLLKFLVPDGNFNVFTNDGSGVMIAVNDGYTFDLSTGTVTAAPGNYIIKFAS